MSVFGLNSIYFKTIEKQYKYSLYISCTSFTRFKFSQVFCPSNEVFIPGAMKNIVCTFVPLFFAMSKHFHFILIG